LSRINFEIVRAASSVNGSGLTTLGAAFFGFRITEQINGGREMKLKPLHDRILVERIEEEEEVRGGIVIPDTAKEKPQEGKVVAVGPGKTLDNGQKVTMSLKKGDRVLFGKYSGTEVKIDDRDYLIMREDDVLGVLTTK